MSKWVFVCVPCLTCLSFLTAGARTRQIREVTPIPPDPLMIVGESADQASPVDGSVLLEEILTKFRAARWLQGAVWQRSHDREHPYESTARLVLGPDHCARLEATMQVAATSCQHLVVSDGRAVAEVERYAGEPEKVSGCYLPGPEAGIERAQFLRRRGCAGPLPLLTELQSLVVAWKTQHGVWNDRPVVRLSGVVRPKRNSVDIVARSCRLYVDAVTHLPLRLEWLKHDDPHQSPIVLEMEFRDLDLDRALSPAECARFFTYQSTSPATRLAQAEH